MNALQKKIEDVFALDVRSLALFRIGLGLNLIADLLIRSVSLKAFYTDSGLLPRSLFINQLRDPLIWSLHLIGGTVVSQVCLFLIQTAFAMGLLIGYRTRLMTFLSWLMLTSLHNRLPYIQNSGDVYLRLSLLWSCFIPLGACWSVDRVLDTSPREIPMQILSGGTFALLMQMVVVYGMAAIPKFQGTDWYGTGQAVYYTLRLDIFATRAAHVLLLFPRFLRVLTYGVMGFEALAPLLLLIPVWTGPVRTFVVLAAFAMHASFGLCLRVDPFPRISMLEVLPFLPAWFWVRVNPCLTQAKSLWNSHLDRWRQQGLDWLSSHLPRPPLHLKYARWQSWVAAMLWGLGTYPLLVTLFPARLPTMPSLLTEVRQVAGLDQAWNMFSPEVSRTSGWFIIPGKLQNGREVDLYRNGAPVSWAQPPLISASFKTERWRRFFAVLLSGQRNGYHAYSQYLCHDWNESHTGPDQLQSLRIVLMSTTALPDERIDVPRPKTLWLASCIPPLNKTSLKHL